MKNVLIILNYNDSKNTIKLLNRIRKYTIFDRIIVVDNCSKDNSYEQLKKYNSSLIDVIRTPENKGYAYGNNFGSFYAIKKYYPQFLFIANPDVMFEEEMITKIVCVLNLKKEYALGTALVDKGYNVWKNFDYKDTINSMFLFVFNLQKYMIKKKIIKEKNFSEVEVVGGAFFGIKADIFQEIGGFDERTFLYYEENILGLKLKRAGYKEIIITDQTYQHLRSSSIKKEYGSKAKAFINYKQSISVYLNEYLKVNDRQFKIFEILYPIASIERKIFDFLIDILMKLKLIK